MGNRLSELIELGSGSVVLRRRGGREFGLHPAGGKNVLWRNPLSHSGTGWENPGGGRTWVSPEAELFFPDQSAGWNAYTVPAELDPGDYRVLESTPESAVLGNRFEARFFASDRKLNLELEKRVTVLPRPDWLDSRAAFAGYRLETRLSALEPVPDGVNPAIWNLLQLPPGGKITVAGAGRPQVYFGRPGYEERDGMFSIGIPAAGESYKLGFRPPPGAVARLLYVNHTSLVVREFRVAGSCFDTPFPRGSAPACPLQVFSDNGTDGGFGEMEYHSEALTPERTAVVDHCLTWACVAEQDVLETISEQLLR